MKYCKSCFGVTSPEARFCPFCGTRFADEKRTALRETEDISIHHWLDYNEENIFCDSGVCRCDDFSYGIHDTRANDLRIKRIFHLKPNTIYYVSADVQTEDVINRENLENPIGACLSTNDWFCSRSLFGTNDWQTVGVLGRSDSEGRLFVSCNLGYYFNTCSGSAWFENFRFTEIPKKNEKTTWRFLAVILTESGIDTVDEGKRLCLSHSMTEEEILLIRKSLRNFEKDFREDGEGLVDAEVDILELRSKCTAYSKSDMGYHISAPLACRFLEENGVYIEKYDHVFMIVFQPSLPASYFGLGGLPIKGRVGFSFILHTDVNSSLHYLSGKRENSWVSTIYMHEFLHSIESLSNALSLPVPAIDGERFGYADRDEYRLWYRDFIHNRIMRDGKRHGVDARLWQLRPTLFP